MKLFKQWFSRLFSKSKYAGENPALQNPDEKEFIFIWYKKMQSGSKTYFTQPFRTKIKARTKLEAKAKLTNFALGKMTLEIFEEKDIDNSEIMKMQKEFDRMNVEFQKAMEKLFVIK